MSWNLEDNPWHFTVPIYLPALSEYLLQQIKIDSSLCITAVRLHVYLFQFLLYISSSLSSSIDVSTRVNCLMTKTSPFLSSSWIYQIFPYSLFSIISFLVSSLHPCSPNCCLISSFLTIYKESYCHPYTHSTSSHQYPQHDKTPIKNQITEMFSKNKEKINI